MYDNNLANKQGLATSPQLPALEEFVQRLQKTVEESHTMIERLNNLCSRLNTEGNVKEGATETPVAPRRMSDGLLYKLENVVYDMEGQIYRYERLARKLESIL